MISPTQISLSYPQCFNLSGVYPLLIDLFPKVPIPQVPLARRLSFFFQPDQIYTYPNIIDIVQGFEIPFFKNPVEDELPKPTILNQEQTKFVKE